MAGTTGLEPATSAVTGQRSNQLNYVPRVKRVTLYNDALKQWAQTIRQPTPPTRPATKGRWWAVTDLNRGPSRCKRDALTAELTAQPFYCNNLQARFQGSFRRETGD